VTIDLQFAILLLPIITLATLSFIDDRQQVPAIWRLLVQIWLAVFVFLMGIKIDFIGNPFAATNIELAQDWPALSFLATVIWIVAIQNAMNWFDGIKGLTVGVSGVGFLTLALLGLWRPELFFDLQHTPLTTANFYLAGICIGAFWFYWKGKIILGDTGSQVLGFLLAVMSIWSGAKIATTLLVLSLPLIDLVIVVFRRVFIERKSPLSGDLQHLPHNLARKVGESLATVILVIFSLVFGLIAVGLFGLQKLTALVIVLILVAILTIWAQLVSVNSLD